MPNEELELAVLVVLGAVLSVLVAAVIVTVLPPFGAVFVALVGGVIVEILASPRGYYRRKVQQYLCRRGESA